MTEQQKTITLELWVFPDGASSWIGGVRVRETGEEHYVEGIAGATEQEAMDNLQCSVHLNIPAKYLGQETSWE